MIHTKQSRGLHGPSESKHGVEFCASPWISYSSRPALPRRQGKEKDSTQASTQLALPSLLFLWRKKPTSLHPHKSFSIQSLVPHSVILKNTQNFNSAR